MRTTRGSRSPRATAAAVALAFALPALAGCGGSDGGGTAAAPGPGTTGLLTPPLTQPPGTTLPAPPGSTTPAPPRSAARYAPPPIRVRFGRGPLIGALARERHASSTFGTPPPGFAPGGVPVGTRAAICVVPPLTDALRAQITAAAERQTPSGHVLTMHSDAILLADCGPSGRWAVITWTVVGGSDPTDWIDELRDDGGGRWTGTPRGAYPGCRMPLAAAAAWQLDVTRCPASARRAPSAPTPRAAPRATPQPPRQARPRPAPRPSQPAPLDSLSI
jgi:hypothetical protein